MNVSFKLQSFVVLYKECLYLFIISYTQDLKKHKLTSTTTIFSNYKNIETKTLLFVHDFIFAKKKSLKGTSWF